MNAPRPLAVVVAQVAIGVCASLGPFPAPPGAEGACTMFNAAEVLPAGPGVPNDDDVFPVRDRIRLRDNFGFVLQELRKKGTAFRSLAKGPWSVFIAIAAHFQLNAEAWPGQEAIAQFSGCTTRAVRFHVGALERGGFLVLRRERRPDGGERIFYGPGPVMRRELAAFSEDYPRDRPKVLKPVPAAPAAAAPTSDHLPEARSGPLMERVSMEPDQDQKPSSSCAAPPAAPQAPEEEKIEVTEDREVARAALVERMARKHPKRPPPRWFDAASSRSSPRARASSRAIALRRRSP